MKKRKEVKRIKGFKENEVIGMRIFKDRLIIATKHGVYEYPRDEKDKNNENP